MVTEQTGHKYRQEKNIGSLNPMKGMARNFLRMISLHRRSKAMGNLIVEVAIMVGGTCANLSLMTG